MMIYYYIINKITGHKITQLGHKPSFNDSNVLKRSTMVKTRQMRKNGKIIMSIFTIPLMYPSQIEAI